MQCTPRVWWGPTTCAIPATSQDTVTGNRSQNPEPYTKPRHSYVKLLLNAPFLIAILVSAFFNF